MSYSDKEQAAQIAKKCGWTYIVGSPVSEEEIRRRMIKLDDYLKSIKGQSRGPRRRSTMPGPNNKQPKHPVQQVDMQKESPRIDLR